MFRVCRCDDVEQIYTLMNAHVCAGFCVWLLPSATDSGTKLHFLSIQICAWINTQRKPTKESSSLGQHLNLSLLSERILWGNCSSLKMPILPHVFVFGQPAFLMLEVEDVCFIVKYIGLSQWIDQFLSFLATLKLNWIKLGASLIKSGICCYHREEKNVFYFTFFCLSF